MSHRGRQAKSEDDWRRGQYHDGRIAGKAGAQGMYSDQFYQRGYRDGEKARKEAEARPVDPVRQQARDRFERRIARLVGPEDPR